MNEKETVSEMPFIWNTKYFVEIDFEKLAGVTLAEKASSFSCEIKKKKPLLIIGGLVLVLFKISDVYKDLKFLESKSDYQSRICLLQPFAESDIENVAIFQYTLFPIDTIVIANSVETTIIKLKNFCA